jgi:hypothetical protein
MFLGAWQFPFPQSVVHIPPLHELGMHALTHPIFVGHSENDVFGHFMWRDAVYRRKRIIGIVIIKANIIKSFFIYKIISY